MSSEELVDAYVEGSISRREFIRRLAAAGVSLGAAVSYAHLLAPESAVAGRHRPDDFYVSFDVSPARKGKGGVYVLTSAVEIVRTGRVPVLVQVAAKATVHIKVDLLRTGPRNYRNRSKNSVRLAEGRVDVGTDVKVYHSGRFENPIAHLQLTEKGERNLRKALKHPPPWVGLPPREVLVKVTGLAVTPGGRKSWDQEYGYFALHPRRYSP